MARTFIIADVDAIEFPTLGALLSGVTIHTVLCKFRVPNSTAQQRTLFSHTSNTDGSAFISFLTIQADNTLRHFVQTTTPSNVQAQQNSAAVSANVWHTGGGIRDGDDIFAILDNTVSGPATSSGFGTFAADEAVHVGGAVAGSTTLIAASAFEGDLCEVAVWDVRLTQAEIDSYDVGANPQSIRPSALIFYAPIYGTTNEPDLSGSGNVGTLIATPVASDFHAPVSPYKKHIPALNQSSVFKKKEIDHVYVESLGAQSVTGTTFATVVKVDKANFPPLSRWWLFAQGNIAVDSLATQSRIRIQNDGVDILGSTHLLFHKTAAAPNFFDGTHYGFSKIIDFDETPGDIELQISNSGANESQMQSPNIFMLRLDKDFIENKDYWYRESQAKTFLTTSFGNSEALVFTIPHPVELLGTGEDFMVIGCIDMESGGAVSDTQKPIIQMLGTGVASSRSYSNRNQLDEHLTVLARVGTALSLAGTLANMTQAVNNAGSESNNKFASLFVMRRNLFNQSIFVNQSGTQTNVGTGNEQLLDLDITPNVDGNFLAIGSVRIAFEAGSTAGLRNANIMFARDGGTIEPPGTEGQFSCDAEFLTEVPAGNAMAYFKDLPTTLQDIELLSHGNQANQVSFLQGAVFLFSLLPANHFKISGTVFEEGSPVSRTVRAFLSSTGEFLGETTSNVEGAYEICGLPGGNIFVVAFDDAGGQSFNAQIFDKVVPVV